MVFVSAAFSSLGQCFINLQSVLPLAEHEGKGRRPRACCGQSSCKQAVAGVPSESPPGTSSQEGLLCCTHLSVFSLLAPQCHQNADVTATAFRRKACSVLYRQGTILVGLDGALKAFSHLAPGLPHLCSSPKSFLQQLRACLFSHTSAPAQVVPTRPTYLLLLPPLVHLGNAFSFCKALIHDAFSHQPLPKPTDSRTREAQSLREMYPPWDSSPLSKAGSYSTHLLKEVFPDFFFLTQPTQISNFPEFSCYLNL